MPDPTHDAAPGGTHRGRTGDTTSEADNLTTESIAETRGYGAAVDHYRRRGWRGILPIVARGRKYPPPPKFTGHGAPWPSGADIAEWQDQYADHNVALRVPENVIGIDVDAYPGKRGATTLALAVEAWGTLPPTWTTTSRNDGVSGIRLYRLPGDARGRRSVIKFDGTGDIEVVRTGHRYAMVWPSVHPDTGATYTWRDPAGTIVDTIPGVDDLAELPSGWVTAMCDGDDPNLGTVDITDALNRLTTGPINGAVSDRLDRAIGDLAGQSGSRHDATLGHVMALLRLSEQGETGVVAALEQLRTVYAHAVQDRLTPDQAADEFNRMVTNERAHQMIAATPTVDLWEMSGKPRPAADDGDTPSAELPAVERFGFTGGGAFVHDEPEGFAPIWGSGDAVLMTEGEALMVAGPQGVGKTTLVINVLAAAIGDEPTDVLGMPVRPGQRVLYLAMDRPRQLARAMRRQLGPVPRDVLDDRLTVWKGPPPHDLAKNTGVLAAMAEAARADIVVVDSLKDAALGLVDDEVGSGWNRARQTVLADERNIIEIHHIRKLDPKKPKPTVDDIYGSVFLTAGTGSILLINGQPGDSHVTAHHIKQPGDDVGPLRIAHDTTTGVMSVEGAVDVLAVVRNRPGVTAIEVARLLFDTDRPDRNQKAKAARRLDALADAGHVEKRGGERGGSAATYTAVMLGRSV